MALTVDAATMPAVAQTLVAPAPPVAYVQAPNTTAPAAAVAMAFSGSSLIDCTVCTATAAVLTATRRTACPASLLQTSVAVGGSGAKSLTYPAQILTALVTGLTT